MKGLGGGNQAVSPHIHRPFRPSKRPLSLLKSHWWCFAGVECEVQQGGEPGRVCQRRQVRQHLLNTCLKYTIQIPVCLLHLRYKSPRNLTSICVLVVSDVLWVRCLLITRWYYQTQIGIWYDTIYLLCEQIYEVHIMYKTIYTFSRLRGYFEVRLWHRKDRVNEHWTAKNSWLD